MKKQEIIEQLEQKRQEHKRISKWRNGLYDIAIDRIDELDNNTQITWYTLLNGALWQEKQANFENISHACNEYAWGGCGLIYDIDIAELLATKSEMYTRTGNFKEQPNNHEQWLDVYARAVYQAFRLIMRNYKDVIIED